MDLEKLSAGCCPVGRALALVGDGWSMLILRDAGFGLARFEAFRESLGIAPNILANRLKSLTEAGLLAKTAYSERPPREEYRLTEAGRDFLPILYALGAWGARHGGGGPVTTLRDAETGTTVQPLVIDAVTGAPLGSRTLVPVVPAL
jgi:DNA-binding HxlR family transcriptional regulator